METIYSQFNLEGGVIACHRFGSGHINETHLVVTDRPHLYILQKLNTYVFRNPEGLMGNVAKVTEYLRKKDADPRHVLTLIPTKTDAAYYVSPKGDYWRMCEYITDSVCLDMPRDENDFYQSAVALGAFQRDLAEFPADTLVETIPHFHDTPDRYAQLKQAVKENRAGRLDQVQEELAFYMAREEEAGTMVNMLAAGELPLRVTHNDTKLNNVMLDRSTGNPICVIDLDTVMPGLAGNDFGDSIRFGANTAAEDETDLSKVKFSLSMYEAYTKGFLSACGDSLTQAEKDTLPMGAKLMTLECGSRFLADYLNGDVYFHVTREHHNLDRTRTQIELIKGMEAHWEEMQAIIRKYSK